MTIQQHNQHKEKFLNQHELGINKITQEGQIPDNASVAGLSPLKNPSKKHFNHHYLSAL